MRDKTFQALLDRKAELLTASRAIIDGATDGEFTAEARAELDGNTARLDAVLADLARLEAVREAERQTLGAARPVITGGHDRAIDRPWASMGEFFLAVAAAGTPGGHTDPRLYQAAASGLSEGAPSDGGFLVRSDFSTALLDRAMDATSLAGRCRRIPIGPGADGLEAPIIDETSRATGSRWGGVQVYRRGEADTVTASKPRLGLFDLRLEDLMGLAYATDRLLRDATALEAVLSTAFTEEFAWKIDNEIIRGTGVGEGLGVLNADALVSVDKETGQQAATVVPENIVKMYARIPQRYLGGAFWAMNQDVLPQLLTMGIQVGVGGSLVFMGDIKGQPGMSLLGLPIVRIEQASTLGTVGDLMLLNLNEYILIEQGGIDAQQSMHVRFIYNERAFRWVYRINGRPKWHSALTPANGSSTVSPYVALATRS